MTPRKTTYYQSIEFVIFEGGTLRVVITKEDGSAVIEDYVEAVDACGKLADWMVGKTR